MRPHDVSAAEGDAEVVIPCEVGNREGRVQWTKDGLTLGKNEEKKDDSFICGEDMCSGLRE